MLIELSIIERKVWKLALIFQR